jgi:hypothetical protein
MAAKPNPLVDDQSQTVEAIASTVETPAETPAETPVVDTLPVVKGIYATEYFKAVGIPYCKLCGAQYCSDRMDGSPICPESFPVAVCPRLKQNA